MSDSSAGGNGSVEIIGGKEFRRSLKAAGVPLSNMTNLHKQVAQIAADAGRREAPVGEDTPHLAKTIRAGATQRAAVIRAGNNSNVRYAGPIHWGWGRRHIKANPFLTRGAQQTEPRWTRLYEDYVDKALDLIKGK